MASRRERLSAQRIRRASKQRDKETRPRGIEKEEPRRVRRSARLEGISRLQKSSEDRKPEQRNGPLSIEEDFPPPLPLKGQKRPREVEHPANHIPTERPRKRRRPLPAGPSLGQTLGQEVGSTSTQKSHIPVRKPQATKKQRAVRKSARLQAIQQQRKQSVSKSNYIWEVPPSPPASRIPEGRIRSQILHKPSKLHQKRKRGQEARHSSPQDRDRSPSKELRTSSLSGPAEGGLEKEAESDGKKNADPLETWIQSKRWPSGYFEQDSQVREDFKHNSWLEEQMEQSAQVVQYVEINGIRYPRPIKKVPTSLRRKQSDTSLAGSSDQKKRENKSAPYRDTRYNMLLAARGSYMREFDDDDIPKKIMDLCQTLLERDQTVPQDSLFRDDLFKKTCRKIEDRNEAMIIQDITRLIVPSAQNLAIYGATHLDHLIESVNEGWTGGIPVEGPRPQPDYSVGFRRSAFTDEQLNRLDPLIGNVYDTSFFVATYRMYFPFLTCEVKCGAAALDIADRQNAHSITLALRGIVELFRLVKREKELHREILAFSISHDHATVRIYGHYPVISGNETTFYRHPIRNFGFTELDGKEKWSAYKFTKNVYNVWMPTHLKCICSVIDQLPPDVDFEVSQESELQFTEASGLSQELGGLLSEQSNVETASRASQDDSDLAPIVPQTDTPDTSVSQETALKRPKRKHAAK